MTLKPNAATHSGEPAAEATLSDTTGLGQNAASLPVLVSIIIPCYNKVEFTERCLEALFANTPASLGYEVILVDNASTDSTPTLGARLEAEGRMRVIRNESNLGFAKACNRGAGVAQGGLLLFLNNDTVPLPGWLEPLLETLGRDPRIAVVGSKLLYPDGRVQHAGVVLTENNAGELLFWDHVYRLAAADIPWVNQERDFQVVTGACYLIRRDVFEVVGGFHEAYRNGCEDIDLSLLVRKKGFRVVYCPRSVLYHHESVSEGRHQHNIDNLLLLHQRWAGQVQSDRATVYADDGRLEMGEVVTQLANCRAQIARYFKFDEYSPVPGPSMPPRIGHRLRDGIGRWLRGFLMLGRPQEDMEAVRLALVNVYGALAMMAVLLDRLDTAAAHTKAAGTAAQGESVSSTH